MTVNVFAVPVFFVVFRETLETVVIVSVLLAWLKQTLDGPNRDVKVHKKLRNQVWFGVAAGTLVCLIIGGAIIGVFYSLGRNKWASAEYYWEGSFALLAAIIIGILGAALLRVSKLQEKWRVKLAQALEDKPLTDGNRWKLFKWAMMKRFCKKYALFMVPFITILREGLEAIVFITGVTFSSPPTAFPLPVICGLIAGVFVGWLIYKGGASSKLQLFLVISTCVLYLVAAGLFSRSVWYFEVQKWNDAVGGDAAEVGSGPGSYDIDRSVWHVNYGNPGLNGGGGWGIFNALLGWTNSATYGSVISYNLYWLAVIVGFSLMRYKEVKGHWPLIKAKKDDDSSYTHSPSESGVFERKSSAEKNGVELVTVPARTISE